MSWVVTDVSTLSDLTLTIEGTIENVDLCI